MQNSRLALVGASLIGMFTIGACTLGQEDSAEDLLAAEEAARRAGKGKASCAVAPDPVDLDASYTVTASRLPANTTFEVVHRQADGSENTESATSAADGTLSLTAAAPIEGTTQITFKYLSRNRYKTAARCSVEVVAPCVASSCGDQGANCGSLDDGCGTTLDCGSCSGSDTCGAQQANVCGACTPDSCAAGSCGTVPDGCGGSLDCGGCSGSDTCGGAGVPNQCGSESGGGSWPADWAAWELDVLNQFNVERAAGAVCGDSSYAATASLQMEPNMRTAARLHSKDMADNNYFSHTSLDGRTFVTRMTDAGWGGACPCGENIAGGYSVSSVVGAWMNSPGHCRNIMNGSYNVTGVGYADGKWTANYAYR